MAEAAVESPSARFFCHKCTQEINPVLPDYICPRCQSGFIEELVQSSLENPSNDYSEDDADPTAQFVEFWGRTLLDSFRTPNSEQEETQNNRDENSPSSSQGRRGARGHFYPARVSIRRRSPGERAPSLEGLIQQIFAHLTGAGAVGGGGNAAFPISFLNLHGNPGDYAWGRGGLDAIITQLLNQLDGTGPPPLSKDKISQIPTVHISQEQVGKTLQCTVCMEDFKLEEPVRRLSCLHHFHTDCIVPWLELHGTCPICRKLLNDEEDGMANGANHQHTSNSSVYDFNEDCD